MWEYKSHPENIMVSQTNCASSCPLACMLIAVWGLPTNPKSWVCWRSWFVLHQRPEIHHVAKLWHVALMLQIVLNTGVQTPKTNTKTMTKTISEGVWSRRVCFFLVLRSFNNFQTWLSFSSTQESMCPRSQIACCSRFAAQLREEAGLVLTHNPGLHSPWCIWIYIYIYIYI